MASTCPRYGVETINGRGAYPLNVDHIWSVLIKIHYRIVRTDTDLVMGQHAVAESGQFCLFCFRSSRQIGDQKYFHWSLPEIPHFNSIIICKNQKLYWHTATLHQLGIARCYGRQRIWLLFSFYPEAGSASMSI